MKGKGEAKRGIPRRAGKRSGKILVYYNLRYPFNKLKKILRHNGPIAAQAWAQKHMAEGALMRAKKALGTKHCKE